MKTILSIPLIILILFTGVSVKFATHYCGGNVAATKISLTGEFATCGMTTDSENHTQQQTITHHCCDNTLSAYSICNTYFASAYDAVFNGQVAADNILNPIDYILDKKIIINITNYQSKPPGSFNANSVDRPVLCIFRI
jgi:hypothetical protein